MDDVLAKVIENTVFTLFVITVALWVLSKFIKRREK